MENQFFYLDSEGKRRRITWNDSDCTWIDEIEVDGSWRRLPEFESETKEELAYRFFLDGPPGGIQYLSPDELDNMRFSSVRDGTQIA